MRRLFKVLIVLAVILVPGYYFLVMHSPSPGADAAYPLDVTEIRRLAEVNPGPKASEIRVEKVAELVFAEAMVMAGEPWQGTPIPIYSYQLVFPNQSIIVDTAMTSTEGMPEFFVKGFDSQALQRMNNAMEKAEQILVTHEHFDHIGGILEHPRLPALLPKLVLTREQLSHEDRMQPLTLPEDVFDDYQPLEYEGMLTIAPGVVLIEAPGHTPGSQMVYVQQADGTEVLLLGDVAWQGRNIHAVRERPLFITAMIRENRSQVINQFQALHDLAASHPEIRQVSGHDGRVVEALLDEGVLKRGF